ncbi:DUF4390 domain-containing protein [Massilia frigida]
MTQRFFRLLACQLLLMFASACACVPAWAADVVDITHAHIEASDEGYRLAASYAFELNEGLEDAIKHGVQLYFTTEIELTRPRWYWYDDKAVSARQTIRIWYNVLTRQYHVSALGSMAQSFLTLEDAMVLIRRPSRWVIAPKGALKRGETYNATVRMFMDRELLPKPMQVNALNNSDWRLASKNKTFPYTAE